MNAPRSLTDRYTDEDRFITPRELAAMADCNIQTIERCRKKGDGPTPYRFGGRWKYRYADAKRWVDSKAIPIGPHDLPLPLPVPSPSVVKDRPATAPGDSPQN